MNYKYPKLRNELIFLHDEVKDLLVKLDMELERRGWPNVMLTEIKREASDQEAYYWQQIMKEKKCNEAVARRLARAKRSWHLWYCGADFSSKIYDEEQKKFILAFLKNGRPGPKWEIFLHNVGQGSHFHVAFEDPIWEMKWSKPLQG